MLPLCLDLGVLAPCSCLTSAAFLICRYCAEASFRITILEQRLERQEALVTKKFSELEHKLAGDPRLAVIHNPAALAIRSQKAVPGKGEQGHAGAGRGKPGAVKSPARL